MQLTARTSAATWQILLKSEQRMYTVDSRHNLRVQLKFYGKVGQLLGSISSKWYHPKNYNTKGSIGMSSTTEWIWSLQNVSSVLQRTYNRYPKYPNFRCYSGKKGKGNISKFGFNTTQSDIGSSVCATFGANWWRENDQNDASYNGWKKYKVFSTESNNEYSNSSWHSTMSLFLHLPFICQVLSK